MTKTLYGYLTYFLHPFQVNNYFKKNREDLMALSTPFLIDDESSLKLEEDILELDFSEILIISWVFLIISGIYSLLLLNLSAAILRMVDTSGGMAANLASPRTLIFFTLGQAVLFPLGFYFYAIIWEKIVYFFTLLFSPNLEDIDHASKQVVAVSMTAHTFLLVPVLGTFIFHIAFAIYLFAGLKCNLGFRTLPALITILSPLFVIGFCLLVIILLIVSLIMGF